MESLSNVFDWSFFWGVFGFLMKVVAPFIMLVVAIKGVGMLLGGVVNAIFKGRN